MLIRCVSLMWMVLLILKNQARFTFGYWREDGVWMATNDGV
jgi:hypothetical protein